MQRCVIGVDLGGTNVRAQAFFDDGSPAGVGFENPSRAQKGTAAILDSVASTIRQAEEAATGTCEAIGLSIPGHVDSRAGVVRWAPNFGEEIGGVFHYWKDVPIREPLKKYIDLPLFMDNDANLAALGEYRYGCGENKAKAFVMITLGTGIGGGVILTNHSVIGKAEGPLILVGGNHGGAELGHIVVDNNGLDCNAGTYGTVEAYCQRDAIVRRAQYKLIRGRDSVLSDLIEGDHTRITPRLIFEGASQGDEMCIEVFREVGEVLGVGIANYINIFAPDVLAVGGQVSRAGDFIMKPAIASARNNAIMSLFNDCKIQLAHRIGDAGMLGAAALAFEGLKWK